MHTRKHTLETHTCHVAVNFEGAKRSAAIGVDPVGIGGLAQMLVGLTRRLIDRWSRARVKKNESNHEQLKEDGY